MGKDRDGPSKELFPSHILWTIGIPCVAGIPRKNAPGFFGFVGDWGYGEGSLHIGSKALY